MATNAANVQVDVTGEVYSAPVGSTLPTSTTTTIASPFVGVGFNSPEGVTETFDESRTELIAWQRSTAVRSQRTSHSYMISFTMWETTAEALKIFHGDANYTSGVVKVRADAETKRAWIVELIDGSKITRICIPNGVVTDRGPVGHNATDATARQIEITCYEDSAGVKAYQYFGTIA